VAALVLDTRALEMLADRRADPVGAARVRAMLSAAARLAIPVRVPTAVLSEAYRGRPVDAAVDHVLRRGVRPITMGHSMARVAGALRARDGLDSCHTVDAFVVATSIRLGGGIIATADPGDLQVLARDHPSVHVQAIG
jgi:predicted nucleic acid-binding protein